MGHWYDKNGTPKHYVLGKNRVKRSTTLRDARKHNWIPSVSTVWSDVIAKPMLYKWKEDNLMKHMHGILTGDEVWGEVAHTNDYMKEARDRFSIEQKELTDRGILAHESLSQFFSGEVPELSTPMIQGVTRKLNELCGDQDWKSETTFAHHFGYGGQVDLHCDEFLVDFKTKDLSSGKSAKSMVYLDHGVQLAAYDTGLGKSGRKLMNLFVDVETGEVQEYVHEDPERNWDMFKHALELWKLMKKYDPKWYIM